jgi:hypothetical protein
MKLTRLTKEALHVFTIGGSMVGSEFDYISMVKIRTTEMGLAFWTFDFHEVE